MRIIPSIDLFDGKVVRLVEGDFHRKTEYLPGPAAVARAYASAGFGMLHCVDLDGAKNGAVAGWDAIEAIVSVGALSIQVGGGIRTAAEISRLLKLGVDRVVIGSIILGNPGMVGEWIETFGPERFCAALDLNDGHIAVRGWQDVMPVPVSEVVPLLQKWGIRRVISTDIRRDGTMVGPNVALYRNLVKEYPGIEWIASGGIGCMEDVVKLKETGSWGVVVGRALMDGRISPEELVKVDEC